MDQMDDPRSEAAWAIVDPVNAAIASGLVPLREYKYGSRGTCNVTGRGAEGGGRVYVLSNEGGAYLYLYFLPKNPRFQQNGVKRVTDYGHDVALLS